MKQIKNQCHEVLRDNSVLNILIEAAPSRLDGGKKNENESPCAYRSSYILEWKEKPSKRWMFELRLSPIDDLQVRDTKKSILKID